MKILLLSDIHGNIESLKEIINKENFDYAYFIGDAVDYGPRPAEVVEKLKEIGANSVLGNHDNAILYNVDCMCGEETHWISVYFRENFTKKLLNKTHLDFLKEFKNKIKTEIEGFGKTLIIHGSPSSPLYGYIYPWLDEEKTINMLNREVRLNETKNIKLEYDLYIVGHTHFQFMKKINNSLLINPGSAGEPRDGDNRAAYAIINTENKTIELRRIKYNIEKVVKDLEDLMIPEPYLTYLKYMFINGKILRRNA
ncbi:MAG: metallophosphoesterase [Caldisphaera sp.]|jgi:protein phosphatase|uniref:metallophosphoesterase family protein n=1 Tax=Caldisphaera sp. TaxID=2060322 RepID=UPI000CC2EDC4|nr:MAG: metallophosphoesterase [Caldisphaera sp.]PMP90778.1 MAG: metallophosphoesterase [Caldisphaera sp.]